MNDHDDLTRSLGRELHGQVDRITEGPISLEAVKGTAGRIRRRRAVAAGAATLAAVAIIVPLGVFGTDLIDRADREPPVATGSVDPTGDGRTPSDPSSPSTPPEKPDGPAVINFDAPQGDDPEADYLDGRTLHLADGSSVELPEVYDGIARAGNEFVATRETNTEQGRLVEILDESGEVVDQSTSSGQLVGSPDGSIAAWVDQDGTIQTRADGTTTELTTLENSAYNAFALSGSGSCAGSDGDCAVHVQPFGEGDIPGRVATTDGLADPPGGLQSVQDVSKDGHLAATVSASDADPDVPLVSAVFDPESEREVARFENVSFDFTTAGFSPDGSMVVGRRHSQDAAQTPTLEVLEVGSSDTFMQIELDESLIDSVNIQSTTWEDDQHLLVKVSRAGDPGDAYSLFRVGLDGSVERVLEQDHDNGTMTQPWTFPR